MDSQLVFSYALADCIFDADKYGLDRKQTNCGEVMNGPVHGDASGDLSCTLYGSDFTFIGEPETGDGGETGGEQSPEPTQPYLVAYPAVADANASRIDWSGGGWPELVALGCDLNRDCCKLFDPDICRYTDPTYAMPGGAADWSVADATTEIDIAYQGCSVMPGPELVLDGRADLSLAACDGARCPIYLAALTLELPAEAIGTFSTSLFDGRCADKTIEHFELRLVHAALGSRDPVSDRIAFPIGALVFEAAVDVSAMRGELGAGEYRFSAFNDHVVWGHASEDGQLSFERDSLSFSELGVELGVRFEAEVVGSPPTVEVALPRMVACEPDGSVTVPLLGFADDIDGDLLTAYWSLDGDMVHDQVTLPIGQHTLTYRAVDRRAASTTQEMVLLVEDAGAGESTLRWSTMDAAGTTAVEEQLFSCDR